MVTNPTKKAPQNKDSGFYTMKEYQQAGAEGLTSSMEDYLEMICRLRQEGRPLRVNILAESLHVKPSSASKMLGNLKRLGYIDFQKYGAVSVTDKGLGEGEYLLHRHQVLQRFFCALNGTEDELEQVEKVEHFMDRRTVENLEQLLGRLEGRENDAATGQRGKKFPRQ